ncbi:MAG: hypothetical protein IT440_03090 [Phycisphaeraceae bacterium]|nr:hypothetical protein [Phycisphaeraceae bacterium]
MTMHFFLSYPKAGRTWVRFMLDSYACKLAGTPLNNVFDAEKQLASHLHVEWSHLTAAMLFKLHYWQMGFIDPKAFKGKRAVLMTRNIYATMTSAYFQAVNRVKVFAGTPAEFIRSPQYGIIKLVTFYNLCHHLMPGFCHCHAFTYEQLKADPTGRFRDVLTALDMPMREELIEQVIAEGSAANMRALSTTPAYAGTPLAPSNPDDPQSHKVRASADGEKQSIYSPDDMAYIRRVCDDLLVCPDEPWLQGALDMPAAKTPRL